MTKVWTPIQVKEHINKYAKLTIPNALITNNFSWAEVMINQTEKADINVLNNLFVVTRKLQLLRDTVFKKRSIKITSGWRSPKYNADLRSKGIQASNKSYHTYGMALDFVVDGMTPLQVQKLLDPIWIGGLEYTNGGWSHIDTRPYQTRFDNKNRVYAVGEFFKGK